MIKVIHMLVKEEKREESLGMFININKTVGWIMSE